jgi:hypothetical protein
MTDGRPNLRAVNPIVAAAVNTIPTFKTRGAVSTIDAMSKVYLESMSLGGNKKDPGFKPGSFLRIKLS